MGLSPPHAKATPWCWRSAWASRPSREQPNPGRVGAGRAGTSGHQRSAAVPAGTGIGDQRLRRKLGRPSSFRRPADDQSMNLSISSSSSSVSTSSSANVGAQIQRLQQQIKDTQQKLKELPPATWMRSSSACPTCCRSNSRRCKLRTEAIAASAGAAGPGRGGTQAGCCAGCRCRDSTEARQPGTHRRLRSTALAGQAFCRACAGVCDAAFEGPVARNARPHVPAWPACGHFRMSGWQAGRRCGLGAGAPETWRAARPTQRQEPVARGTGGEGAEDADSSPPCRKWSPHAPTRPTVCSVCGLTRDSHEVSKG